MVIFNSYVKLPEGNPQVKSAWSFSSCVFRTSQSVHLLFQISIQETTRPLSKVYWYPPGHDSGNHQETIRKPSGICKCILISNLLVYTLVYLMSSYAIRFINHHQPGLISGLSIFTNHRICRLCRRAQPWYCYSSRRLEAMHWAPWWPLPQPTTRLDNCSKKQRWLTDLKTWY